MVKFYYNHRNPFDQLAPEPLVQLDYQPIVHGDRWGMEGTINMEGTITGSCTGDFAHMYNKAQSLVFNFSKNFGMLAIVDDAAVSGASARISQINYAAPNATISLHNSVTLASGNSILVNGIHDDDYDVLTVKTTGVSQIVANYSGSRAGVFSNLDGNLIKINSTSDILLNHRVRVNDITFDEDKFYRILPFSVNCNIYPSSKFSGDYGVLDPVDEFVFDETDDGLVTLTHTVSARGFNTSSKQNNALENARNYVAALTGWNNQILPHYIESPDFVVHTELQESVNRMGGEFSVVEKYIYDPNFLSLQTGTILRYTADYSRDDDGATVSIQGSFQAGLSGNISTIKTAFPNINWYNKANGYYTSVDSGNLINRVIGASITENPKQKSIDFSLTYTDDAEAVDDVIFSDKLTINYDLFSQKNCVSLNGRFEANSRACNNIGWSGVLSSYSGFSPYNYITGKLQAYDCYFPIPPTPQTFSYSEDPINKIIEFNYTYCESNLDLGPCFEFLEYSLDFTPAIPQYAQKPTLYGAGEYVIQDLGFDNRAVYSIQGSAKIRDCCTYEEGVFYTKAHMNQISSIYFVGNRKILESESVDTGNLPDRLVRFSATWSAEAPTIFPGSLL
jgi:hypothetical protein